MLPLLGKVRGRVRRLVVLAQQADERGDAGVLDYRMLRDVALAERNWLLTIRQALKLRDAGDDRGAIALLQPLLVSIHLHSFPRGIPQGAVPHMSWMAASRLC